MNKSQLTRLFTGILAGDGDIGSRMASSSPYAKSPYPPVVAKAVAFLDDYIGQGKADSMTAKEKQKMVQKYVNHCIKKLNED